MFSDLDISVVDKERSAIHVVEFFVWWEQAGRWFYHGRGRGGDEGLEAFARDAVVAIGGWKNARRILREMEQPTRTLIEAKGLVF